MSFIKSLFNRKKPEGPQETPSYLNGAGSDCLSVGEIDKARSFFDKALALEEGNAEALYGRSMTFYVKGNATKATEELRKALKADPSLTEAGWQLARVCESREGPRPDAIAAYKHFIEHASPGEQHPYRLWHAHRRIQTLEEQWDQPMSDDAFFVDLQLLIVSMSRPEFHSGSLYEVPVSLFDEVMGHVRNARIVAHGVITQTVLNDLVKQYKAQPAPPESAPTTIDPVPVFENPDRVPKNLADMTLLRIEPVDPSDPDQGWSVRYLSTLSDGTAIGANVFMYDRGEFLQEDSRGPRVEAEFKRSMSSFEGLAEAGHYSNLNTVFTGFVEPTDPDLEDYPMRDPGWWWCEFHYDENNESYVTHVSLRADAQLFQKILYTHPAGMANANKVAMDFTAAWRAHLHEHRQTLIKPSAAASAFENEPKKAEAIDLYLVHATLNPDSGTDIRFLPNVQGFSTDSTIENLGILLKNLSERDLIKGFDEEHWDNVQFWRVDGALMAPMYRLEDLPSPRAVVVIKWTSDSAPVLPSEQSRSLAQTILQYASENDPKYAEYFGNSDETGETDSDVEPAMQNPSTGYEVRVRFEFRNNALDLKVFENTVEVVAFEVQSPPPSHVIGHGVEIVFSSASVQKVDGVPIPLADIGMTLLGRLDQHPQFRSPDAEREIMQAAQDLGAKYLTPSNVCLISLAYLTADNLESSSKF